MTFLERVAAQRAQEQVARVMKKIPPQPKKVRPPKPPRKPPAKSQTGL